MKTIFKRCDMGIKYLEIRNSGGKVWLVPFSSVRKGLELYQPSSKKGHILKKYLSVFKFLPFLIEKLGIHIVHIQIDVDFAQSINELFDKEDIYYSIFLGTPGRDNKPTIQLYTSKEILGYCKYSANPRICDAFRREAECLEYLHRKGVRAVPAVLLLEEVDDGQTVFIQSTGKRFGASTQHEITHQQIKFLQDISEKTQQKCEFAETDYYKSLCDFKKNHHKFPFTSSGGAFTAISDVFLSNGDAVVSPIYNYETCQTEFEIYQSPKKRDEARGSKYMQSYPLNTFREAEKWLRKNDGDLLFVGVGCQSDGFRRFLEARGLRDRATIVGIICHGSPSPMIWKDYVKEMGSIANLNFRDKRNDWHRPVAHAEINGREKSVQDYLTIFYNKCALRPSCYQCPYATTEREVDLTIGDFWGIEKALPDYDTSGGVSLVLVHTEKGLEVFEKVKNDVEWRESSVSDCLQPNLIKPTERSPRRNEFWNDYKTKGIQYVLKKYAPKPSLIRRIARKVKGSVKGLLKK